MSAQFSGPLMIGTHCAHTPPVYPAPTLCQWICVWFGEYIPGLGTFQVCLHSYFLLGPLRSLLHEYQLPDSQGCMECLSRPSMPISFPESRCLALWYSTTSHQKLQPQGRRAAGFSFLSHFWVWPLFSPDKASPHQQQSCWFSETASISFQFIRMIIFVKFVQLYSCFRETGFADLFIPLYLKHYIIPDTRIMFFLRDFKGLPVALVVIPGQVVIYTALGEAVSYQDSMILVRVQ